MHTPKQPCMPPTTMHPPQPCMPPSNHTHTPATMHEPHNHAPPTTMHAPLQPHMPPQQPHMPPANHACPPPPPVDRMTHMCKNITLPQTSFAGGKNRVTRLHSSRMHTAHALTVSPSMLCSRGVPGLLGVSSPGGVPGLGGCT